MNKKNKNIIKEYIKFKDEFMNTMMEHYSHCSTDDNAIIKLFLAQRKK